MNILILKFIRAMLFLLLIISMFSCILNYVNLYYYYIIKESIPIDYFYLFLVFGIHTIILFIPTILIDNKIIKSE